MQFQGLYIFWQRHLTCTWSISGCQQNRGNGLDSIGRVLLVDVGECLILSILFIPSSRMWLSTVTDLFSSRARSMRPVRLIISILFLIFIYINQHKVFSCVQSYTYGISAPFWFAVGCCFQICESFNGYPSLSTTSLTTSSNLRCI